MTVTSITNNTTVQNGTPDDQFTGTETTYLGEESPTYAYDMDAASTMSASPSSGAAFHPLVRFTGLSNIPAFASITTAAEYLLAGGGFNTFDMAGNGSSRPWVFDEATWDDYNTGNAYTAGGGTGAGDLVTPAPTTNTVSGSGWHNWDFQDYVQDVVDGLITNNGFIHPTTDTAGDAFRTFGRPEHSGVDGDLPELLIDWTAAGDAVSESFGLGDTITATLAASAAVTEGLGLNDTQAVTAALTAAIAEGLGLNDTQVSSLAGAIAVTVTEGLGLNDTQAPALAISAVLSESLGLTDAQTARVTVAVVITEGLGLTDTQAATAALAAAIAEGLGLTDTQAATAALAAAIAEGLGLNDLQALPSAGFFSGEIVLVLAFQNIVLIEE